MYHPDPQFDRNQGNVTMINSGGSSQFEIEQRKNLDTDVGKRVMEDFSHLLKQQSAFFNKCKKALEPKYQEKIDENVTFYQFCMEEKVLAFPIFSKVFNHSLLIKDYKLHTGKCKAMKGVLTLVPSLLQKIYLDSCGFKGSDLCQILEGLIQQVQIRTIVIQNNEIDSGCVSKLGQLLERKMPYNLQELSIYHCRIGWQQTSDLLAAIRTRNQLNKLSLVRANINEFSLQYLFKIIKSKSLNSLDISWNNLTPKAIKPFLEEISTNRKLSYISLAWNNLSDVQAPEKDQKETLYALGQMIKHNKNLLHMDITSTGLSSFIIKEIGTCLRRARSILSIHLSGNPGLNNENFDFLVNRLRCRPNEDITRFSKIEAVLAHMTKDFPAQYHQSIMAKQVRNSQFKQMDFQPIGTISEKVVFQRIIGFKDVMPGTGQWYQSSNSTIPILKHYKNSCWLCEGHIYSIIFWSRGRAYRLNPIFRGKETDPIRWEVDNISEEDKLDPGLGFINGALSYAEMDDQVPYITGSFTGWRYKKMIPLHEFTKSIDQEWQDPIEQCKYEGQIRRRITEIDQFEDREKAYLEVMKVLQEKKYRIDWHKYTSKFLPFKQPYLINGTFFEGMNDETDVLDEGETNILLQDLSPSEDDTPLPLVVVKKKKVIEDPDAIVVEPMPVPPDKSKWDIVYVLPIFLKPGNHSYMVKFKNTKDKYQKKLIERIKRLEQAQDGTLDMQRRKNKNVIYTEFEYQKLQEMLEPDIFVYKCQVQQRQEPLPICKYILNNSLDSKQMNNKVVERTYKKECSVFKDWRQDTPELLDSMIKSDLSCWKIEKFVKTPEDVANVAAIIATNSAFLKDCFLSMAAVSSYPAVTLMDYSNWAVKCKIIDQNVNLPAIDRTFIATNLKKAGVPDFNPIGNSMSRYEFFEVLVRVSQLKYKDTGLVKTFPEAIDLLVKENILKFAKPDPWQGFRDTQLWTLDVCDVLDANLENLKKIYATYLNQNKKFMNIDDCINLAGRDTPAFTVSEKDAKYSYAMCKMTVTVEYQNYKKYQEMVFVEFLEFIGRLSDCKFSGTSDGTNMPLAQKIEFVLDDILPAFGMTRNDVNIAVEEFSESDDEY